MADATLLILQHIACEPPAAYEDEMLRWGAGLHRVEVDEGEPLPDWRGFDGIVAMGGPMGAYDDDALPRPLSLATEWAAVPAYAPASKRWGAR
jgi:GMP synthase (glutamine-hydrolysing)